MGKLKDKKSQNNKNGFFMLKIKNIQLTNHKGEKII